MPSLEKQRSPLSSAAWQRELLSSVSVGTTFEAALRRSNLYPLTPLRIDTLQVNVGKKCNQTCHHCHVDAAPDRQEMMSRDVIENCLTFLDRHNIPKLDITGGAPELHPDFREIVVRGRAAGAHVMHRCNLTAVLLPNYSDIPELLAAHQVEIIASLPYFQSRETDKQRGAGVFDESIESLRQLNALGYGNGSSGLLLNLVTNPVGSFLPANQRELETMWKREMQQKFGIVFDNLYTITNMPIARFLEFLESRGQTAEYLTRLVNAYNPGAAQGVMCRSILSVNFDGGLSDCDFNQMLALPLHAAAPQTIAEALRTDHAREQLQSREIVTGPHCFGCTAGAGSSCGGAVA
ncbi:MAG: arsenosugar biosynthesis radical SAM protein ArsS [Phycisphaerae bacterium]|nr:arsenosugar biosynthesis radical SAM protein ArsS [Gemmatimonadaceae bacterium]